MGELLALAERVEKAAGPDRALGDDILLSCGWTVTSVGYGTKNRPVWVNPNPSTVHYLDVDQPNPTGSLDAAKALVPEGWRCGFEEAGLYDHVDQPEAWCWPRESSFEPQWQNGDEGYRGNPIGKRSCAATPALALCAAALRARASLGER